MEETNPFELNCKNTRFCRLVTEIQDSSIHFVNTHNRMNAIDLIDTALRRTDQSDILLLGPKLDDLELEVRLSITD